MILSIYLFNSSLYPSMPLQQLLTFCPALSLLLVIFSFRNETRCLIQKDPVFGESVCM